MRAFIKELRPHFVEVLLDFGSKSYKFLSLYVWTILSRLVGVIPVVIALNVDGRTIHLLILDLMPNCTLFSPKSGMEGRSTV